MENPFEKKILMDLLYQQYHQEKRRGKTIIQGDLLGRVRLLPCPDKKIQLWKKRTLLSGFDMLMLSAQRHSKLQLSWDEINDFTRTILVELFH